MTQQEQVENPQLALTEEQKKQKSRKIMKRRPKNRWHNLLSEEKILLETP